jgi:hypothetical protein
MHTNAYNGSVTPGKPTARRKRADLCGPISSVAGVAASMPAATPSVPSVPSVLPGLPACLVEAVDTAVAEAFAKSYSADPLIPEDVAALRGPVDSVLRRHGLLIETALAVALDLLPEVEVMTQVAVPISEAAIQLCLSNADDRTIGLTLPVTGAIAKTALIDVVVHYPRTGRLVAVSVKRGGGPQSGTAARNASVELRAAAMILRAMLMGRGRVVSSAEVVTVDYLGRSGILNGTVIGVEQIDAFFGLPVRATLDAMTSYMSAEVGRRIDAVIEALVRRRAPQPVVAGPTPDDGDTRGIGRTPEGMTAGRHRDRPSELRHGSGSVETPSMLSPSLAECLSALPKGRGRRPRLHA